MTDSITDDLKRDEGLRLKPYLDSVGKVTIGYGRNIDDVGITEREAEAMLANDIARTLADLNRALPWWRKLPSRQQRGLQNMCFNLGLPRLLGFKKMLAALKSGDRKRAAEEALDSKWAGQVGERAERIAELFRAAQLTTATSLRASTEMPVGFAVAPPPQWADFLERYPDQKAVRADVLDLLPPRLAELIQVSAQVRESCPYKRDSAGNDSWRILRDGEPGDCEDLALTVRARLVALGWPIGALRVCWPPANRRPTLVLGFIGTGFDRSTWPSSHYSRTRRRGRDIRPDFPASRRCRCRRTRDANWARR